MLATEAEVQRREGVEAALEATQQERDRAMRQRDDELAARSSVETELRQVRTRLAATESERDSAVDARKATMERLRESRASSDRLASQLAKVQAECLPLVSLPLASDPEPAPLATVDPTDP